LKERKKNGFSARKSGLIPSEVERGGKSVSRPLEEQDRRSECSIRTKKKNRCQERKTWKGKILYNTLGKKKKADSLLSKKNKEKKVLTIRAGGKSQAEYFEAEIGGKENP